MPIPMDLEQLTKHQIILLTLLVSFITSIATGIVTVSLMNQAPAQITRTINQVVQQTGEKVVPQATSTPIIVQRPAPVAGDTLAQTITTARKAVIRITARGDDKLIARGVIISSKGMALTDREALGNSGAAFFDAILASGERVPLTLRPGQTTSIAVIDAVVGTSTGFTALPLFDFGKLTLGQGVIRIGGVGFDTAGQGIISLIPSTSAQPTVVEANLSSATLGSVLLTLSGQVIGLSTSVSQVQGSDFYSIPVFLSSHATTTPK